MFTYFKVSIFVLIAFLISSCALHPEESKRATCNTLKSQIVFNGSTSNTRQAEIQRAEAPLQQRTYDVDKCDERQ